MSSVNNQLIVKNTIFLYMRMLFVLAVNLYAVRAILNLLGVVDYGIYNAVGSIVGMFSFINGTLASSSQRYFSVELAKGDTERLKKWFNLNITAFSVIICIFLVIAETVGLWFLNNKMTIPDERLVAANVVFQFSVISCLISLFSVPYNALLIAHEKMGTFAFIGIGEALFKLLIVFVLWKTGFDRLIVYGILLLLLNCGILIIYMMFCRKHFPESHFKPYWNKKEFLELFSFSGWHFLGTISSVVRSQGINLLLNVFFNPAVNAARAISYQVNGAVSQFTNSFQVAVKPQLYKTYSEGEYQALYKLINRSTIFSFFLSALFMIPLFVNCEYVLELWLKNVPDYAVFFTKLVLINGLLESTNTSAIVPALATGKIKKFEIVICILGVSNLPLSYAVLKLGAEPYMTIAVAILLTLITIVWRAFLLRDMIHLPYKKYLTIVSTVVFVTALCLFISLFFQKFIPATFIGLIISVLISTVLLVVSYYVIAIDKNDRNYIIEIIRKALNKFKK